MRIQIELHEDKVAEIRSLMEAAKIDTYKEFIENAVAAFAWLLVERTKGRRAASIDENLKTYQVLVMPALEAAAPQTTIEILASIKNNGNGNGQGHTDAAVVGGKSKRH